MFPPTEKLRSEAEIPTHFSPWLKVALWAAAWLTRSCQADELSEVLPPQLRRDWQRWALVRDCAQLPNPLSEKMQQLPLQVVWSGPGQAARCADGIYVQAEFPRSWLEQMQPEYPDLVAQLFHDGDLVPGRDSNLVGYWYLGAPAASPLPAELSWQWLPASQVVLPPASFLTARQAQRELREATTNAAALIAARPRLREYGPPPQVAPLDLPPHTPRREGELLDEAHRIAHSIAAVQLRAQDPSLDAELFPLLNKIRSASTAAVDAALVVLLRDFHLANSTGH